jgi:PadR family transcriptional regulator, regulatory protein PadR
MVQTLEDTTMAITKDLVAASAGPLVLTILAEGENYGYAIIKRVNELSAGRMQWTDGMLYPVLHRLERQGLIASRWGTADTGRKRKYYRLKDKGTKALQLQQDQWRLVYSALARLWEAKPCSI